MTAWDDTHIYLWLTILDCFIKTGHKTMWKNIHLFSFELTFITLSPTSASIFSILKINKKHVADPKYLSTKEIHSELKA